MRHLTRQQAMHRILPENERVSLLKYGKTFEKGGFMYPDCGHRPVDFRIAGFGWIGRSREYLGAYGYHIASKPRRYLSRGMWLAGDVTINKGLSPALNTLINTINAMEDR